jgi:hypothetical protein
MCQTLRKAGGAKIVFVLLANLKTVNKADGLITQNSDWEALE